MTTIVYGHPYSKSFNAAIRNAVIAALKDNYTLIDLYADGFDPAARKDDLALYSQGRTNDPLAQKYMDILAATRRIIYIFPVWWGVEPAIVKGFHDKTLLKDFAWSYSPEGRLLPRLNIEKTTVFTTSDAPSSVFSAYFEDYFPSHVLNAVGMSNVSWHNFENILRSDAKARSEFLAKIPDRI